MLLKEARKEVICGDDTRVALLSVSRTKFRLF